MGNLVKELVVEGMEESKGHILGKKTNKVNYVNPLGLPGTDLVVQKAYKSWSWKKINCRDLIIANLNAIEQKESSTGKRSR